MIVFKKDIDLFFDEIEKEVIQKGTKRRQNINNKWPKSFKREYSVKDGLIKATLKAWRWIVEALETGRGRTKKGNQGGLTLREKLVKSGWIEKVLKISDIKEQKSAAFVISRKIHQSGTNLFRGRDPRFGTPSGTISDSINQKRVDEFGKKILANIKAQIANKLRMATK